MMSRSRLLAAWVVAVAAAATGCAHCDTCDDFPAPCLSGNCGGGFYGPAPTYVEGPAAPAPPAGGGAFSAPADEAAGAGAGAGVAEPVESTPEVPDNDSPPIPTTTPETY